MFLSDSPTGLEGEIFGFYMILSSTIKGNVTTKVKNQVTFTKNKISNNKKINYVVLGDLLAAKTSDVYKESFDRHKSSQSHVKISAPLSFVDYDVGKGRKYIRENNKHDSDSEMDIFDLDSDVENNNVSSKMKFWNLINKAGNEGKFKKQQTIQNLFTTENPVFLSVFETPPPIDEHKIIKQNLDVKEQNVDIGKKNYKKHNEVNYNIEPDFSKHMTYSLPEVETPPPINNNNNVFGQWSSANFANRVLSYIRNGNKDKNFIPATIPLRKTSDSYPYPSEFKVLTVKPFNIVRPNSAHYKIKIISKRQAKSPEINVRIQSTNIRDDILQTHLENKARNVMVTSRGEPDFQTHNKSISSSNTKSQRNHETNKSRYNRSNMDRGSHNLTLNDDSIPPPIRTFENDLKIIQQDNLFNDSITNIYFKSNKLHNDKTYKNYYLPKHILPSISSYISGKIKNKHHDETTPIGIHFKQDHQRFMLNKNHEKEVIRGRKLASDVANQANPPVKFGYFQAGHNFKVPVIKHHSTNENYDNKVHFNKSVKLGNALDEGLFIGLSVAERKRSFLGGNDEIPDINRYRSDIDKEKSSVVPPSLRSRVCNNADVNGRTLYVHNDGTIDLSHIISPIKLNNLGIIFVKHNYKNCLLDGTVIEQDPLIFIDWNKTPVRLFGGARPKITKDICGFF